MAGITGGKDEKGVVSYVVPFFCPADVDPSSKEGELSDTFSPKGGGDQCKEQSRTWKDNGDGSFSVYITYEGGMVGGDSGSAGAWFGGDGATYEMSASMKDIPIEGHPGITGLMQTYHGTKTGNGVVEFASGTPDSPNPMYGCKTFKCVSATLRRTTIVNAIDSNCLEGVGSVYTKIGSFPQLNYQAPDGKGGTKSIAREWLKMAPSIQKRGNVFTLTDEYMLSPKGGFPQYMYDLIQS